MKFVYLGPQAISGADFGFFIIATWVRNHNLFTPPMPGTSFCKKVCYPHISVRFRSSPVWPDTRLAAAYYYSINSATN